MKKASAFSALAFFKWEILYKQVIHRGTEQEQGQESEVIQGEATDIVSGATGIVFDIFPEGDQAGQRCDQGTYAADVYTDQKVCVVSGELGQEDGGGNITDALAGQGAEQQGISLQQLGEGSADGLDPRHISCKNKEEHKGQEQGIVYHLQSLAVCKEQSSGDHQQTDPVGDHTEDDDNRQCEEGQVQCGTLRLQGDLFVIYGKGFGFDKETAYRDQKNGDGKGDRHDPHKFIGRDLKFGVEVQVLRIAEGGQHTA